MWSEPNRDEKLTDFLLEWDEIDGGPFPLISTENGDASVLPASDRGCIITSNWDLQESRAIQSSTLLEEGNTVIENRGAARDLSNVNSKDNLHLNPIPENWCVIVQQYCTAVSGGQPRQRALHNDWLQMPVLTVRVICIDRIELLTSKCDSRGGNWETVISDWHQTVFDELDRVIDEEQEKPLNDVDCNKQYRNTTEAFYRTILCDALLSYEPLSTDLSDPFRPKARSPLEIHGLRAAVKLTIDNRRLFITAGGTMGLCSAKTQIGDEVFFFSGAVYPYVIRRTADDSGCTMVEGTCYLDGWMDGVAFLETPELDDFILW